MNEDTAAMLGVVLALIGGMVSQKAINRERLLDYLLRLVADLSPEEREQPYGRNLQTLVQLLESTQFPGQEN